jgi:TolA-binding protein
MKTKEELVQEAQQLQQQINNLVGQQNKVLGKIELLEEQEKVVEAPK